MTFEAIMNYVDNYIDYEDVYAMLKELDIDICYDDDMVQQGYARIYSGVVGNCLFIKTNLEPAFEQFLILHELAHFILHRGTCTLFTSSSKLEYEANMFACLWLIKNQIDTAIYYDIYLLEQAVPERIISSFQDSLFQYRQAKKYKNSWYRMEC